jgi:hypothetical protein
MGAAAQGGDTSRTDELTEPGDEREQPTRQEVFETLSNERRRLVLHALKREGATELRDLSRQVAAWENEVEPGGVTSQQRRRVYNALQQSHLPKMDENAVVDYDHDRGTVEPTAAAEELTVYLEVVPDRDISWGTYYTLLGTICAALCAAVAGGLYPFDLLSLPVTAVACALFVAASGVVHRHRSRRMEVGRREGPPEY